MNFQYYIEQLAQDKLLTIAFPVFLLLIIVERFVDRDSYTDGKDTFVSISLSIITAIVEFIPKILAFATFMFLHELSPLADIVQRQWWACLLYTSPSPRDQRGSRMPSSA